MSEELLELPRLPKRVDRSEFKDILCEYASYLFIKRYTKHSIKHYRNAIEHFFNWLKLEKISFVAPIDPIIIKRFLNEHMPICQCRMPAAKSLRDLHAALYLFLRMQQESNSKEGRSKPKSNLDKMMEEFDDYLLNVCGIVEGSRIRNQKYVRIFLAKFFSNNSIKLSDLTPIKVRELLYNNFQQYTHSGLRVFIGFIRRFFRFLQFKGVGDPLLIQSLPKMIEWKSTNLPNSLNTQELKKVLATCDRSSAIGKRDYAIIIFMLELGLRANEVANLTLDSINWHSQIVHILSSKSRKSYELPMTQKIMDALIDYLKHGRPKTTLPHIFVYHVAHSTSRFHIDVGQGITPQIVSEIAARAITRSGVKTKPLGSHVLRKTFATNLLRKGATIKEIADLLGHSSIDTATIYTKVDFEKLAQVSLPWLKRIK